MEIFEYDHLFILGEKIQRGITSASWGLLALYFIWILIEESFLKARCLNDLLHTIIRLFIVVILISNIKTIRNFFYDTSIDLANFVYSEEQIKEIELPIKEQEKNKDSIIKSFKFGFFDKTSSYFLMIFKGLYYIVTILLMFLRNFGHFICYITAPLAIIFFLSEKSSFITVSFFKRFLALCLWPVFISAIYLVVSTITSPNFKIGGELNIFESVAYLLIFSLLLTVVPLFASQFVSGLWGVAEAGFMQRVFSLIPMTGFLTPIKGVTSLATSATNHSKSFAKDKFLKTPTYNGIKRTHERLKHTKLGENKAYQSMHKNLERAFKPKKIVEAENQAERIKEKQFQKKLNYLLTKNLGRKT